MKFGPPTTVEIPTLITDRLVLRSWLARDVGPYTAMAADPEMSRYTGSPASEAAVWRMTAFQIGHWALRGYGMWIAEDRPTGQFVGRVGLYEEYGWAGLEVAWTIRRDRWGDGLATEGGAAALEYGFATTDRDHIISIIHPDNAASSRVAQKLGLTIDHFEEIDGEPRNIWTITRSDWQAARP